MKYIILASFALLSVTGINAQVFIGLGFSKAQLSESALDAAGFSLMVEKDFNLSKSTRWKIHPNLHVSFLFSDAYRDFEPSYSNPFLSMLLGLQSGDPVFESSPIDKFKGGIESGIRIDIVLGKTTMRLIPIAVQLGGSSYRQGMISYLFRL